MRVHACFGFLRLHFGAVVRSDERVDHASACGLADFEGQVVRLDALFEGGARDMVELPVDAAFAVREVHI